MPIVARIYPYKNYGFEIRSDWHFCPNCGDKIICTNKHQEMEEKAKQAKKQ
jgi:predicted RNA-binding Zn-ribbon protein involved in translation (DUF1610 family)